MSCVVPGGRLELPSPCEHSVLNTARLPFRHPGAYLILAEAKKLDNWDRICHDKLLMRRFFLLASFFTFTPVLIFVSILFFLLLSYDHRSHNGLISRYNQRVAFAALPSFENVLGDSIISKDARIEMLKQFFQKYKSPLTPFAQNVVESADKYGLDFRLIPAIAMQESNLCHKIIIDSHNCWGFGIYGKKVTRFENYPEAIETVTKTLAKNYIAGGLNTPKEIMTKYTPSNNGDWADSVSYFMNLLQ